MRLALLVFVLLAMMGIFLGLQNGQRGLPPASTTDGTAAIGAPFTLTDANGKQVSDAQFRGKFMLVFFGFSHCPDICPVALGNISTALQRLGSDASQVTPVFISIDPAQDTPHVLRDFGKAFDPRIVMLTGSQAAIDRVANAYKVYVGEKSGDALNHSGYIYVMDRTGAYQTHLGPDATPDVIARTVRAYLKTPIA